MSNIPDAISADELRNLLSSGSDSPSPMSDCIPEINFGGAFGGICDLQYVMSLIIAKSTHGVNMIQLMMSSLHLISEAGQQLERQIEAIKDTEHPKFRDLKPQERESIGRDLERQYTLLRASMTTLEQVLETYAPMATHVRLRELIETKELISGAGIETGHLRSMLLFSTELIESLGISRDSITAYLNSSDAFTTP